MILIGLKSGKETTVCGVLKSLKLDKMTGEVVSIKIENKSSERLEWIDIENIDYIFVIETKEEKK